MIPPHRAHAIYLEWQRRGTNVTISNIARRYSVSNETVITILTAKHAHTRHLPPIYERHATRKP